MKYAVDFDGTLKINGKPNKPLFNNLIGLQMQGNVIILHTSRTGESLRDAVAFCRKQGLVFNMVFGGKPVADVYIDDKGLNPFR